MDEREMTIDEIFTECANNEVENSSAANLAEYGMVVGPWEEYEETESVSLKDILDLVNAHDWYRKGFSLQVANNLYLYNSKVNIVKAEDKSLIILPEAEVAIDLFHNSKEDFVGTDKNADYYVMEILKTIGREGYVLCSLNEALTVNTLLVNRKEFSVKYLSKGAVVAQGTLLLGKSYWSALMSKICHGAHNWAPCITYSDALGKLKCSLLNYDVICYESLAYIKETKEGDYCIETKMPLEASHLETGLDEHWRVAIFACFDPHDPQSEGLSAESALKYLGMYRFDKERSEKENYIAFKLCHDDKLYI